MFLLLDSTDSHTHTHTHLSGRLDVPLLRLLQLDESGLQQTPPALVNHCREESEERPLYHLFPHLFTFITFTLCVSECEGEMICSYLRLKVVCEL